MIVLFVFTYKLVLFVPKKFWLLLRSSSFYHLKFGFTLTIYLDTSFLLDDGENITLTIKPIWAHLFYPVKILNVL